MRVKHAHRVLAGIVLGVLLVRLALLPLIPFPGINDPNHYYNLGLRLVNGHGFKMDYLWHYYVAPETIVHPFDFWQPMAGILAAASMMLFGQSVTAALLPFVFLGALLPIPTYLMARQLDVSQTSALFVALAAGLLPEFVLNSLRTDTLIPNALFISLSLYCLVRGLQEGRAWLFIVSGVLAGLSWLTRGDNLLLIPMLIVTLIVYALLARKEAAIPRRSWWFVWLAPISALVISLPWALRNIDLFGGVLLGGLSNNMYFTDFRQLYSYTHDASLETLLETQSISQILGKRVFETLAAIRMMITSLADVLPLGVIGGALLVLWQRHRKQWLNLAPAVILLGGMAFAYIMLIPIANQGGSFKKSFLSLVPLLLPLAGIALDAAVSSHRAKLWIGIITALLLFQGAVMFVVTDLRAVNTYVGYMTRTTETIATLPDTNDDGQIIMMAQDPFALRYFGYQSVTIPFEDRETILAVAERYNVDYIMFPPARPALDALYLKQDIDPRFVLVADVAGINVEIYDVNP